MGTGRLALHAALAAWLAALGAGGSALWRHVARAGDAGAAASAWPLTSAPSPDKPQLIVFLHPRCPCSRATVSELAGLAQRARGRVAIRAFIYRPAGGGAEWSEAGVWKSLAAIPAAEAAEDEDGVVARRFGALTSGQAYLYSTDGRLLFSGGLTGGRGHVGPNAGTSAVEALLGPTAGAGVVTAPVFGCVIGGRS